MQSFLGDTHSPVLVLFATADQGHLHQETVSEAMFEFLLLPNCFQPALRHDGDSIAEGVRFKHHMRGDDHAAFGSCKGGENTPDGIPSRWAQPDTQQTSSKVEANVPAAPHSSPNLELMPPSETFANGSKPTCLAFGITEEERKVRYPDYFFV
jgi:hypothetical protein